MKKGIINRVPPLQGAATGLLPENRDTLLDEKKGRKRIRIEAKDIRNFWFHPRF
jgi:hypothetical protein